MQWLKTFPFFWEKKIFLPHLPQSIQVSKAKKIMVKELSDLKQVSLGRQEDLIRVSRKSRKRRNWKGSVND